MGISNIPPEIILIISDYLDQKSRRNVAITCSRIHRLLSDQIWHSMYIDLTKQKDRIAYGRNDIATVKRGIDRGVFDGILENLGTIWIKVSKQLDPESETVGLLELIPIRCEQLEKVRILGTISSCPTVVAQLCWILEQHMNVDVRVCLGVDTSWSGLLPSLPVVKNMTLKFQRSRYESGFVLPDGIEDLSIYCNRISQKALTKLLGGITTLRKLRIDTYSMVISSMTWLPITVNELRLDLSEIVYEGESLNRQRMELSSVTSLHAALLSLEPLEDVLFPNLRLINIQNVPQYMEVLPTSTKTKELWTCAGVLTNNSIRRNHHDRFEPIRTLVIYGIERESFPFEQILHTFPKLTQLFLLFHTAAAVMNDTIECLKGLMASRPRLEQLYVFAPEWKYPGGDSCCTIDDYGGNGKVFKLLDQERFLSLLGCDDESDIYGGQSHWIENVH